MRVSYRYILPHIVGRAVIQDKLNLHEGDYLNFLEIEELIIPVLILVRYRSF